ncbi:hypothetical protein B0H13DRAFT_1716210 [Mycena leptocephala]|nr:hypothetical protein B0H13DRAFT_1716210 [Mycena leptocephala]
MSRQTRPERHRRDRHRSSPPDGAISFQSLFLGLSLVLASGLAVVAMHSLSNRYSAETITSSGPWSSNRTQALIARENAVALREGEVAHREAEVLSVGVPARPIYCPPCAAPTVFETIVSPMETVIIEENSLAPPTSSIRRVQDILRRERRIAERERDVSNSEERVSHREDDTSRRERWILEQLMALHNDGIEQKYIY